MNRSQRGGIWHGALSRGVRGIREVVGRSECSAVGSWKASRWEEEIRSLRESEHVVKKDEQTGSSLGFTCLRWMVVKNQRKRFFKAQKDSNGMFTGVACLTAVVPLKIAP